MDTVTIPRSEYERLKRAAEKQAFLAELDEALASGVNEPLIHVKRKRSR